jgi:hypothetical protein
VADVTLPNGAVMEFEVRFGAHAVSERMPKPPPSRIVQVNLGSGNTRVVVESMPEPRRQQLGRPPAQAPRAPSRGGASMAEPAPEPEPELAQPAIPLCYDGVTVELVGTEGASDVFKVMVCEEQNRIVLQHTGDMQDHLFHELEGAFRTAAFLRPEAGGGGIFGQGLASPFFLTAEVDFSERLSEPGASPPAAAQRVCFWSLSQPVLPKLALVACGPASFALRQADRAGRVGCDRPRQARH